MQHCSRNLGLEVASLCSGGKHNIWCSPYFGRGGGEGEIGVEKETKGPLGSSRGGKKPLQGAGEGEEKETL